MIKNLGRTLFYRHMEYLMGKIVPEYVRYLLQDLYYKIIFYTSVYKSFFAIPRIKHGRMV